MVSKRTLFLSLTIVAASVLCASQLVSLQLTKSEIINLILEFRTDDDNTQSQRIAQLKEVFKSSSDPRQRLSAAVGLGANYLDLGRHRIALQYLSIADQLARPDDNLSSIIKSVLSRTHLEIGNLEQAILLAKEALDKKPSKERQRQLYENLIEANSSLGLNQQVVEYYLKLKKAVREKVISHQSQKRAALAFHSLQQKQQEIEILESLAEHYPLTEEAIWAFHRLIDYNCVVNGERQYFFSYKLLKRLGINRSLETGITEFLIGQSYVPIRDQKNIIKRLSTLERVDFLLALNLHDAARYYLDQLKDTINSGNDDEKKDAISLLARMYFGTQEYQNAARYYALFLSNYPKDKETAKSLEGLAASQMGLRAYQSAAENYGQLANQFGQRQYSWEEFWALYLAKDYEFALERLNRKHYLVIKDPNEPLARNYWRGRILEKLGRISEAEEEFRYILLTDATSYYANLTLARKPSLWAEFVPEQQKEKEKSSQETNALSSDILLASIDASFIPKAPLSDNDLSALEEMVSAGLLRDAVEQLEKISVDHLSNPDRTQAIERLAYYLADYRASRRIAIEAFQEFRRFPKNLGELYDHQRTYKTQWQSVFPIAFSKILNRVEEVTKVDKLLLLSLMRTESRFDIFAKSWVGARGLMQIMPKTALRISEMIRYKDFAVADLFDPPFNISYGGFYFRHLLDHYNGNSFLAIAAYNAGPIAANRWLRLYPQLETDEFVELINYRETRRYVKEVVKYHGLYRQIYSTSVPYFELPSLPQSLPNDQSLF